MHNYKIGLYEKAMPEMLNWKEKLQCAKECGYDYVEMSIDAMDVKINRIYMSKTERKKIVDLMYEIGIPIGSMSISALTKYALGDPEDTIRDRGLEIAIKSIELAAELGVRVVMIPGYDIYFGESTQQTEALFIENIRLITLVAAREGVVLGFETMENNFMNLTEKAMKYVELINSPYLKVYPDSGNITNAFADVPAIANGDLVTGNGHIVALHLKETKPNIYREVPYLTGHVNFEAMIETAWTQGVRRYVTELWYVGQEEWKEDIINANKIMCNILDKQ